MGINTYSLLVVLFAGSGGFTYGYGFGVFVSSVAYGGFYEFFGLDPESNYTASILGAINGLFAFGAAMGALTQGWTSDRFGRKKATFIAASFALVGGALTAGSAAVPMLIVVRILQGFGLGQIVTLSPLYIAEVAQPKIRGALLGAFAMALGGGYTTVAWLSFGTWHAANETLQWRLPLALSCVGPLFQCIGIIFMPESPRYLIWNGRNEEARSILKRLHGGAHNSDSLAEAEYNQISAQVEYDRQFDVSYWQMFKKPSWRKRSLLVMFLLFASQSTGVLGIGTYKTLIYGSLGLTPDMAILMNAVYTTVGAGVVAFGSWYQDKVGRRTLMLIGFPLTACFLLGEALLQRSYLNTDNKAGLSACVLFLFLYIIAYDVCIDPTTFCYVAEIWPTTIRSKGIALAWFAYFLGAITYSAPSALAFRTIEWRMYFVWVACNIVSTAIVYFFVPETKNRTMEEMGELFGDEVMMHLAVDGQGVVVISDEKRRASSTHRETVDDV